MATHNTLFQPKDVRRHPDGLAISVSGFVTAVACIFALLSRRAQLAERLFDRLRQHEDHIPRSLAARVEIVKLKASATATK